MNKLGTLLCCMLCVILIAGTLVTARADTKSDMVAIMDKLGVDKPGNEALIDWDHLVINTPQTKGMNLNSMYKSMDAKNKKAFRTSFLKSFASSFKQSSGGHKFSETAKMMGAITVDDKGGHPTMTLHQKQSKGDLKIFYIRKGKQLLFQGMESKG